MPMLLYVSSEKSSDTRDGRSLDTPFRRILHAIHVAEPDDTIVIVPGVYDQDLAKRIEARSRGRRERERRRERDRDLEAPGTRATLTTMMTAHCAPSWSMAANLQPRGA